MTTKTDTFNDGEALSQRLREHGISPTAQRLEIARVLFRRPAHFSAEEIYERVRRGKVRVSKATVYNTLGTFAACGLVREVLVDPSKVYYDSNTAPHHHFYDVEQGALTDIDGARIEVAGLPEAPPGTTVETVDVIVRLRRR